MGKQKQKRELTSAEKAAKKCRHREYMTVFMNGKQKRIKRPPTIDGMPVDEFIAENADPIWLLQNGMYEELHQLEMAEEKSRPEPARDAEETGCLDDELPF